MTFKTWFWFLLIGFVVYGSWTALRLARLAWRARQARQLLQLPQEAEGLREKGQVGAAIALLEAGLTRPTPLTSAVYLPLHLRLSHLYQGEGRFVEAETHARAAVDLFRRSENLPRRGRAKAASTAALEAELYKRLADALDAQGKTEEARAVFSRAEASALAGAAEAPAVMEQRGQHLERGGKHTEAAQLFLRVADATVLEPMHRAHVLNRAALAFYNAGRYQEGLAAAKRALEVLGQTNAPEVRLLSLRQGANCALSLTELETAQGFIAEAVGLAETRQRPDENAAVKLLQAHLFLLRGDLDDCERTADEVTTLSPKQATVASAYLYEADMLRGEYARALARVQEPPGEKARFAHLQQRQSGAHAIAQAQALVEMERYTEALERLAPAEKEFTGDERLRLICRAHRLRAESGLRMPGSRERLMEFAGELDRQAAARGGERISQRDMLIQTARGLEVLGEYGAALGIWQHYLTAHPRPAYLPYCHYYRGTCYAGLGDPDAARDAWRQATQTGADTYHARLARERLTT